MIITKEVEFHFEQIQAILTMYRNDSCVSRELTEDEKHHIKSAWVAGTNTKWNETCSSCWRKALKAFIKAIDRAGNTYTPPGAAYTNIKAEPSKEIVEWVDDNIKKEMV